jgi:hypothetical protein
MKKQEYLDLKKKHEKEVSDFPIAYAFNNEQLEEALIKLGANKKEVVTIFGHGDIVKKVDAKRFIQMLKNHSDEIQRKMLEDSEFAQAAFLYEMDNHEYAINYDGDEDVLSCFGWKLDELEDISLELANAYERARSTHFVNAREWM